MELYTHSPIREPWDGHRDIRVLTLRHGPPEDDIRVTLSTQTIKDNVTTARAHVHTAAGQWDALSYTWGDTQSTHTTFVEQTTSKLARFKVGKNLFAALQHLRHTDSDRQLWIDAICMDQSDTDQARRERGWQIPAMLEIYSMAAKVIIWLGEEHDDSAFAMQFLQQLGEGFDFNWSTYEMTGNEKLQAGVVTFLHKYEQYFAAGMRQYEAVGALLEREWFTRVWTRQEAFAANEHSVIGCGSISMPLHDFRNAMQILGERGLDVRDPKHQLHSTRLGLAITILDKATAPILETVDRVRGGTCKFPVDKVYGCLGMIKTTAGADFVSSIEMGHIEALALYVDFFKKYTLRYNRLNLLDAAGLYQRSALRGPSWMPDWMTPSARLLPTSSETAVSHAMVADATFESDNVLRVHGIIADKILAIHTIDYSADLSDKHWPGAYAALARLISSHLIDGDQERFDDFMRAFLYPLKGHRIPLEDITRRRSDYDLLVKAVWAGKDPKTAMTIPDHQSFSHFQICLRYHEQAQLSFLFTRKGYIGIGTKGTQPGDSVAAILGSQSLLLLRPLTPGTQPQQHQLVGTCSIHSLSSGEALLGPLPAGTALVSRLEPARGMYEKYFHNAQTNDMTFWDPRIDWAELARATDDAPAWKMKPLSGESGRNVPTAEYFRNRGVDIASFDLV